MPHPAPKLPLLTGDLPGVGGTIKQRAEDFFVQELPLYEPSGEGEHVYCEIEKIGLSTFDAIHQLSRALGVSSRDIGYAGLKDARAITRQLLSIHGITEADVSNAHIPGISIRWAARHGNKLRLGHLAGNRFAIKIRGVNPMEVVKLPPVVEVLQQRGMPNYFGEQRFGRRGDNYLLGAALIRGQAEDLLTQLLGSPDSSLDDPKTMHARTLFEQRDYDGSLQHFPGRHGLERSILARLIKSGSPAAAVRAIDHKLRRLWISALQSRLFNDVVARRIETIDRLLDGDLAYLHDRGAVFHVESAASEQPRCDAFEISPTGPMVGHRMTLPAGEPLRIEEEVFESYGLTPAHFRQEDRDRAKGARRPLRVRPTDVHLASGVDEHGEHITVAFTLPPGSYATVFLRELMKTEPAEIMPPAPADEPASPE